MAVVKAKDIPYETLALQKRIEFVKELKKCLDDGSTVVAKTVGVYSQLLEGGCCCCWMMMIFITILLFGT